MGCDDFANNLRSSPVVVSIHAPAWGATSARALSSFPRSVSIHAPAWGATCQVSGIRRPSYVSIHAPAWGATRSPAHPVQDVHCFNPRTRVGCDLHRGGLGSLARDVSIHAPAWGATLRVRRRARRGCVSIHAPAWGATRPFLVLLCTCPSFNPRTRVGCDSLIRGAPSPVVSFNPRTRVGCDDAGRFELPYLHGFQSTHPRGVRLAGSGQGATGQQVSIHAPAWGATSCPLCGTRPRHSFNPRTRVGCDTRPVGGSSLCVRFQSTHPRGVRPGLSTLL